MKGLIVVFFSTTAKILVVFFLINGFIDVLYVLNKKGQNLYSEVHYKQQLAAKNNNAEFATGSINDIVADWTNLPARNLPGIGGVYKNIVTPGINIGPDGKRSNGALRVSQPTASGLLIGSSLALGYLVADDQTISAHLEKKIPGIVVENYGATGQTLEQTRMLWWNILEKKKDEVDFSVIITGLIDISRDCAIQTKVSGDEIRVVNIYNKILEKIEYYDFMRRVESPDLHICQTSEGMNFAAQHAVDAVKETVILGRQKGLPFAVFIMPTPFSRNPNVSNLVGRTDYQQHASVLKGVYTLFHEKLRQLDMPEIIDLSTILDNQGPYFLDIGAHLSGDGNKKVAAAIAERASPLFSQQRLYEPPANINHGE